MDEDVQLELLDLYPEEPDCWPEKGAVKILNHKQLIEELRDRGIVVSYSTINKWLRSGCPKVPGWKKPKFILNNVMDWIQSKHEGDSLPQKTIDQLYKRGIKRTA